MANQEHLALIKQGATIWNQWYKQNKKIVPDLAKANLSGLDLSKIDLHKANLAGANISNTDLTNACLVDSNLEGANFLRSNLENANLKGANLDYVIFSQAKLNDKTKISASGRTVWEIVNNEAKDKNFNGVDLRNSNLFRADLSKADLSHAILENANLNSANLNSAYLFKANLTRANLQNADLRNAYFSQANLTSAYLSGALCCGTYFKDAELKFANLKKARFSRKTMIDFKWHYVWEIVNRGAVKKNLSGADLSNANLQGTNFAEANLANANLTNSILLNSNLDLANLTNTDLAGANVKGVDLNRANLKGAKLKSAIGRDVQFRDNKSVNTNVMLKERPTTLQAPTTSTAELENVVVKNSDKSKKNKNVFGFLLLGAIAFCLAGYYIYSSQNGEFSVPEILPKFEIWQQKTQ